MDLGPALKKVDLLGPQLFNERSERGNGVVRGQQRVEALERAIGGCQPTEKTAILKRTFNQ